jgi:hypothetical protein
MLRFKRKLWVFFMWTIVLTRYYTWYQLLDFYDFIKVKTHRQRYSIRWFFKRLPIIRGFVYSKVCVRAEKLVHFIEKYIESNKDLSDFDFIRTIDVHMIYIQKHILKRSVYLTSYHSLETMNHWTGMVIKDMEDEIKEGKTDKLSMLESFNSRLNYLSDRMGFERFIHLQLLWYYTRSRLLYEPDKDGRFFPETETWDENIETTWEED